MDHLDDNRNNRDYANLALVHQRCNLRKRTYLEYQNIALDKLDANKAYVPRPEGSLDDRVNENVRTASTIHDFVRRHMERTVRGDAIVPLEDLADEISYLAYEKFRFGHTETIKKHVKIFCSGPAPWRMTNHQGETVVSRKQLDDKPDPGREEDKKAK